MEEGKPSATALAVANGIAVLWRSKEYNHLIDPEMGLISEMYVKEAIQAFNLATEPEGTRKELLRSVVSDRPGFAKTPEEAIGILGNVIDGWPFQFAGRKAAIEAEIRKEIKQGKKQIVILGSGFDTLVNRLAKEPEYSNVKFYVHDHKDTQRIRIKVEGSEEYKSLYGDMPPNVVYFDEDLSKTSLKEALERLEKEQGLKRNELTTAVITEAVLFYLKHDIIETTFKTIHDFFGDGTSIIASFLDANKANPVAQGLDEATEPLFSFHSYGDVCELAARQSAAVTAYSPGAMLKKDYGCPDVCRQFANPDSEDYYKFEFIGTEAAASRLNVPSAKKTMHIHRVLENPEFYEVLKGEDPRKKEKLMSLLLENAPTECNEGLRESIASSGFSAAVRSQDIKAIYSTLTDVPLMEQMPPQRIQAARRKA